MIKQKITAVKRPIVVIGILVFAVLAAVLIQFSRAATGNVSLEAESATLSNGATIKNDTSASGNAAVHFAAATNTGGGTTNPGGGTSTHQGTWKIMPLGDSITTGDPYRETLYKNLVAAGKDIDFVGSQSGDASMSDPDHEGHSGWQNNQMSENAQQFVAATMPDIVVVHMGTNDIWSQIEPATALTRLRDVVDAIYAGNPSARIVLSKIILMDVGVDAAWQTYNAGVPQVVSDYKAQGKKIYLADLSQTLNSSELGDGVHPTTEGYVKMGQAYTPVVLQAMQD